MADYFDVDPAATAPCICRCCGYDVEGEPGCQCPACHQCGAKGDPGCYGRLEGVPDHNMEFNEIQSYGLAKRRDMDREDQKQAQAQVDDERRARELLAADA
jgi:hypothetical protein